MLTKVSTVMHFSPLDVASR